MEMLDAVQKGNLTFFANTLASLTDQVHAVQSATSKLKRKHIQSFQKNNRNSGGTEPPEKAQKTGRSFRDSPGKR